jgi:hypothetical protein
MENNLGMLNYELTSESVTLNHDKNEGKQALDHFASRYNELHQVATAMDLHHY